MTIFFYYDPLSENLCSWLLEQAVQFQWIPVTFLISVDQHIIHIFKLLALVFRFITVIIDNIWGQESEL